MSSSQCSSNYRSTTSVLLPFNMKIRLRVHKLVKIFIVALATTVSVLVGLSINTSNSLSMMDIGRIRLVANATHSVGEVRVSTQPFLKSYPTLTCFCDSSLVYGNSFTVLHKNGFHISVPRRNFCLHRNESSGRIDELCDIFTPCDLTGTLRLCSKPSENFIPLTISPTL